MRQVAGNLETPPIVATHMGEEECYNSLSLDRWMSQVGFGYFQWRLLFLCGTSAVGVPLSAFAT